MLVNKMPDGLQTIETLKKKGLPLAYVGDVVGTGSSRKSAINSVQWFMGDDIPNIPNKRTGGIVLGGKIAPIFFNTAEDSGALPIQCDVSQMKTGDEITIKPYEGDLDPPYDRPARLTVTTSSGAVLVEECRSAVGGPDRPLSDADVLDKVELITAGQMPLFAAVARGLVAGTVGDDTLWSDVIAELWSR